MKKLTAIFGSSLFFFIVMTMYLVLDQFNGGMDKERFLEEARQAAKSVNEMNKEVERLEENLDFSNRAIDTIKDEIDGGDPWFNNNKPSEKLGLKNVEKQVLNPNAGGRFIPFNSGMCRFTNASSGDNQDIRMLDFFDEIPFDDKDGGVWKQGWDIKYSSDAFSRKKLLVFVMPHSHNDPGWLKTFDQYFRDQTVKIISNVVDALAKDSKRKFIWAETSYFSMWWQQASPSKKQLAQEQIKSGQLEIVTGGWVMNDESNPHYYNMIDQLMEGHLWIEGHIGVKPKYGWAIDPFGYSSTMSYLLKRMGFEGMLIQRVHYNVKKYLAKKKNLEFMWRQNWDHDKSTDIFTHVMPFYSYDVPHTCGPNPKVCCQFDFRRLPGGGMFCPWHIAPREITENNVRERAETLLDQYKKKAQLYRSNVVLAPLGDDFRYDKNFEVNAQFSNYEKLMKYINTHPEMNAEIKFGTLQDYFHAVFKREGVKPGAHPPGFPSLGGDFFTYADRNDHYWSGYYTSRSFFKHMDRELMAYLRGAEIIYSLALAHSRHHGKFPSEDLFPKLVAARKELALFQHHDGVTGTAKDHVVVDYGRRMWKAMQDSIRVMETSANFLSTQDKESFTEKSSGVNLFSFGEGRSGFDAIPTKNTIIISNTPSEVAFYNSLAWKRKQTVFLHVSEPLAKVLGPNHQEIPHQVSLLWKASSEIVSGKYLLSFVAEISPLGITKYEIRRNALHSKSLANTTTYNINGDVDPVSPFKINHGSGKEFKVQNQHFEAVFDVETGLLTDLNQVGGDSHKMQIRFMKYGTTSNVDRSGAYLFLPGGQASTISSINAPIIVTAGAIYTEIRVRTEFVLHTVRIYHQDVLEAKALKIENVVDIRRTSNFELVMRVESDLSNKDREFFTDLNGFQIQRRKTLHKLPLQANFYPAPSMIFLQDSKARLTLQTQQSNGVASLETGMLEVVMDRRLMQDDNRGLGQGVTDNKMTPSFFNLLLERFDSPPVQRSKPIPVAYQSTSSITLSHQLQHPIFPFKVQLNENKHFMQSTSGLKVELPCDIHLLNLKTLPRNILDKPGDFSTLLLHRIGYDCHFKDHCSERRLTYQDAFSPLTISNMEETTLSLMYSRKKLNPHSRIEVSPMEVQAYKLKLK